MIHKVTIAPKFEQTLERITKDLFVKAVYKKREDQVTDDDFQQWIDYGLGTPVFATGFGQAWYKMVERTVMVDGECGESYALQFYSDEEVNALSTAHALNKDVSRWWGNIRTFVKSLMRA